jgi:putative NADPH-quinone reductase
MLVGKYVNVSSVQAFGGARIITTEPICYNADMPSTKQPKSMLVVVAHPRRGSFNYAIADVVSKYAEDHGYTLLLQDLYTDKFNPVLTAEESLAVQDGENTPPADDLVRRYQKQLQATDVLVIIHPNWWGKPPAIMAGWLDRVLAPGVAYKLKDGAAGMPTAALNLKALVITTSDTPKERETEVFGDPLNMIWNNCVLPYIGATKNKRIHLSPISTSTPIQRQEWFGLVESTLAGIA